MEANPVEVGQRIKKIRNQKGLSQKEFAKRTKSTIPAISNWENGRNLPNKERLKSIADLANISVDELLHGDEDQIIISLVNEATESFFQKYENYISFAPYGKKDITRLQDVLKYNLVQFLTDEFYAEMYDEIGYEFIKDDLIDELEKELKRGERSQARMLHFMITSVDSTNAVLRDYLNSRDTQIAIVENKLDVKVLKETISELSNLADNIRNHFDYID